MKKLFFQNTENFLKNKRFVFQVSDQEKSGMRAAMETSTKEETEQLFDEKKKLDKDKISADYTKKINTYIEGKKAEIKGRETDKEKQQKLESDYNTALEALHTEAMARLTRLITEAESKREENAKAWANGMSETLVKFNREAVKDGLDATMKNDRELYQHVDEIDSGVAMTTEQIKSMLEVIYIEEGRNAALEKAKKMEEKSAGLGNNMDTKAFNEIYNDTVKKTVADLGIAPGYPNNVDMGRMWGLAYEAQQQFGTDKDGKAAYDAYLAALKEQYKGLKPGNYQESQNIMKAFPTPTEWAAQNPEYRFALKKYGETGANDASINQLLEKVQDKGTQQNLRGIIEGIRASEPDPKKQQDLIDGLFKDMGKNLEDVGSLTADDLKKATDINGRNKFGTGAFEINKDDEKNKGDKIQERIRGYLSGVMMTAEKLDYGKYASDMSVEGKAHDVALAYKAYVAEQMKSGSPLMQAVLEKQKGLFIKNGISNSKIEDEMMKLVTDALKSPQAFASEIYDKDWEQEYTEKGQVNERGFVRAWLTEINRTSNAPLYDQMEGALLAVIHGRERSQWHGLIEQQVEAIIGRKGSGNDYLTDKDFKGLQDNIIKGREVYNTTVDPKSKGYVSGMLYHSEHLEGAGSDFAQRYKTYVQEQMNKLDKDEDFKRLALIRPSVQAMAGKDVEAMLRGTDPIDKQMYEKTVALIKTPEDFLNEQKEKDKPKVIESNKKFLDTYNNPISLKDPAKTLEKILSDVPKDKLSDEDKQKKIEELKGELANAKDNDAKLQILAKAKGFADHKTNPDVAENQYTNAAFNFGLTRKILTLNVKDIAQKEGDYKSFFNDVAKQFNLAENGKEVTAALEKIKAADPAKRAAAIAEQLTILANAAVGVNDGAAPTWPFSTEDFETYSKYIADKNNQAKKAAKKKESDGGGGTGTGGPGGNGGAPSGPPEVSQGGGRHYRRRAERGSENPTSRGEKAKVGPVEKDDLLPEAAMKNVYSAVNQAINNLISASVRVNWNTMGINSPAELAAHAKTDAENNLAALDLSKVKDQTNTLAGGSILLTIQGGKATLNADTWAANVYPRLMEMNKEDADKKEVETILQAWQGSMRRQLDKQGGTSGNVNGFPGLTKGVDVRQAIDNRWDASFRQIPPDIMARAAQIKNLGPQYKPGAVFYSREVYFNNGKAHVTIGLSYDTNGKLAISNGNESWDMGAPIA